MKYFFIILISNIILAQNGFENGNTLYKQGNYQEAIDVYETIVFRSKKQSAELYFNLGNCYYKLNKVAPTIYNYEKALLLNPDFESAKNNLEIAKKLQIDDIKVIEKVGIGQYLQNFVSLLHYDAWAWLAIGSGFLIFLFFLVYYFTETSIAKRLFFSAMLLAIVLLAATFSAAVYQKSYSISCRPAIVFAEVTPLLSTPQASAKTIAKLHEGVKVFVLASNNSFAKVQLTDNKIGWIAASAIKELKK